LSTFNATQAVEACVAYAQSINDPNAAADCAVTNGWSCSPGSPKGCTTNSQCTGGLTCQSTAYATHGQPCGGASGCECLGPTIVCYSDNFTTPDCQTDGNCDCTQCWDYTTAGTYSTAGWVVECTTCGTKANTWD
jgi:hypothetical protein